MSLLSMAYMWIFFNPSGNFCLIIEKSNAFICKLTTDKELVTFTIYLFNFYMSYMFQFLHYWCSFDFCIIMSPFFLFLYIF
jgi:hypothetical protein